MVAFKVIQPTRHRVRLFRSTGQISGACSPDSSLSPAGGDRGKKTRGDHAKCCKKALRMPRGFETSHSFLPLWYWLMRILCPVVLPLIAQVYHARYDLRLRRRITSRFVGNQYTRYVA